MVRFSIIIPALNEAKYIGKTLRSLRKQTFKDFEIIVKDGESKDRTVEIAKKYADMVISARDISVGDARNQGANNARGNILVFVDADTQLPPRTLDGFFNLMQNVKVIGGSCRKIPGGGDILNRLLYEFVNISTFLSSHFGIGGAHGNCMFIRKKIFRKAGGFDPRIQVAEEQELVRKTMRFGRFIFLLDAYVVENSRRIREWGRLRLYLTWLIGTIGSFKAGGNQVYEKVR